MLPFQVTVRSALLLTNSLEETVELRLEPPPFCLHPTKHVRVPPCTTYAVRRSFFSPRGIALSFQMMSTRLDAGAAVAPAGADLRAAAGREAAALLQLLQPQPRVAGDGAAAAAAAAAASATTRHCSPVTSTKDPPYRFALSVRRENFPPERRCVLLLLSVPFHSFPLFSFPFLVFRIS